VPLLILASLLALAPPAEPIELRPGFIALAPVGVALPQLGRSPDTRVARTTLLPSYTWGFVAGVHFQPRPRLLLGLGGSFDQVIWSFRDYRRGDELGSAMTEEPICFAGDCYGWNERVVGTLLRLGADLRIGALGPRWMVWARVTPHVAISRLRLDCNDARDPGCERKHTDVGPGLGAGIGAALRVVGHVALGIEANLDHEWLDQRDDPFEALRTWQLGLLAMFSF